MGYTDSSCGAFLGHGMLWTKIFEHFNLDLSGEEAVYITEENIITSRSLNVKPRLSAIPVFDRNVWNAFAMCF
ncbi:hypothetical protein PIB30_032590 [Stylosanthes scabra]|uniref:Uncharacterized protein n=1 Tax=Stylosanthes scabra TaxID=79078 RepID=A0ABU6SCV1_9FABA|nr:hypothetical protein [Stylosanthes scabra]